LTKVGHTVAGSVTVEVCQSVPKRANRVDGMEKLSERKTGITTMTAEEPMTAVAIGTGKYVEFLSGTSGEK